MAYSFSIQKEQEQEEEEEEEEDLFHQQIALKLKEETSKSATHGT